MIDSTIPTVPRPLIRVNNWATIVLLAIGWNTYSAWYSAIPLIYCGMGAIMGWNPLIALVKPFLRKPASAYIPEEKAQQSFNQLLTFIMLAIAVIAWLFDWKIGFYLFSMMTAAAHLGAILGFCVGCFIRYRWLRFRQMRHFG